MPPKILFFLHKVIIFLLNLMNVYFAQAVASTLDAKICVPLLAATIAFVSA